jgi:hypothetical protein
MKYPTVSDVEKMRTRGYDPSVVAEQVELAKRGQMLQDLKLATVKAFAGVKLGNGVGLLQGQGLDAQVDEKNCAAYREKDEKQDWRALGLDELNRYSSSLYFFDEEGMRFHLPAFLMAAMEGTSAFNLVHKLLSSTFVPDQFALLTPAQRQVVRGYLRLSEQEDEHALDREHIQAALAGYWAV